MTEPTPKPTTDAPADRTTDVSSGAGSGSIRLDHFLKRHVAGTGGQAKLLIQAGEVRVNGEPETRRRRKLAPGDVVECHGDRWQVAADV